MAKAMITLEEQHPAIATRWKLHHNKETWYEDQKSGGLFIVDVTFDVDGESVFHVEVSFSQSWEKLLAKVKWILKLDNTLGILVVNITEDPAWECPSWASVPNDYIDKMHMWLPAVTTSQESRPFGSLSVNGLTWANDIVVDVYYFSKGWENHDDLVLVRCLTLILVLYHLLWQGLSRLQPQGEVSFPQIDADLWKLWETIVKDVMTIQLAVNAELPFQLSWDLIQKKIATSLGEMAYDRYATWYGSRKRRLDVEAPVVEIAGPASEPSRERRRPCRGRD